MELSVGGERFVFREKLFAGFFRAFVRGSRRSGVAGSAGNGFFNGLGIELPNEFAD